jgi:hypothetical protein
MIIGYHKNASAALGQSHHLSENFYRLKRCLVNDLKEEIIPHITCGRWDIPANTTPTLRRFHPSGRRRTRPYHTQTKTIEEEKKRDFYLLYYLF